ncbi:AI-2E family transporter [Fulvivirgaceae bacterium PWU4]|uniref:AI-2E family transporter n=1 Tax=Chryseosolibacter histidini TaxID=2782349 RepID=A0AAP2DJJ1_9BACT|nr:AI-2E family transporter [Chryseosolibacter histidini]MBT1697460.1 AI-2E family transporter [Chryseosolibacter histidini]
MTKPFDRLGYIYKLMVVIALSITAVILCRDIVIPLAFAAFLSVVMLPIIKRIERRTNLTLAVTITLVGTVVVLGLLGWLLVQQIINLANDLPNLESKFDRFIQQASSLLKEFNIQPSEQNQMAKDLAKSVSGYVGAFLLTTTNTISTFIQIPIYLFLLLIYREKFRQFFISLLPANQEEMAWKKDIENVMQGYISGLMLVTLIVATLNTIGLLCLGIDHAIFFGILSGVLTIIPYVGIFIGALLPVLMALITKDSAWYAVGVVIVFTVVQFLEGNFITPRITGSKVSINALAAIIALLIGGKILGIAGMILAVPTIGVLKIVIAYSHRLKPFVILLGDDNPEDKQRDPTEHTPPVEDLKREVFVKEVEAESTDQGPQSTAK